MRLNLNSTVKVNLTEWGEMYLHEYDVENNIPNTTRPQIYQGLDSVKGDSAVANYRSNYNKPLRYVEMDIIDLINKLAGHNWGYNAFEPTILIGDKEFNDNNKVKVKLTEHGIKTLEKRHKIYQDRLPHYSIGWQKTDFVPPKRDAEGYTEYQFWMLLDAFSPLKNEKFSEKYYFVNRGEQPVFEEILINDKDLKPHAERIK